MKRVAFARAIAMDPQVLFCDEPSAGLDPRIGRGLDDLIRNLNAAFNMAIVVVTHEMESVKLIADRITMLAPMPGGARVVFQGTYDELRACEDPVVRDFVAREPLHGAAHRGQGDPSRRWSASSGGRSARRHSLHRIDPERIPAPEVSGGTDCGERGAAGCPAMADGSDAQLVHGLGSASVADVALPSRLPLHRVLCPRRNTVEAW